MKMIGVAVVLGALVLATASPAWADVIVRNKLDRPVVVKLPGGKSVQIRPRERATIGDDAATSADVQRLVQEGALEIVPRSKKAAPKPSKDAPAERKSR